MEYIISVGTNIGDRQRNIENSIKALSLLPGTTVTGKSRIYETEPVGYEKQQNFYNIILKAESSLEPGEMLGACLGIEAALGRVRSVRFGPRVIDLDIIFAENNVINTENLTVPHPRYDRRRFILEPLLDLFPDGVVYGTDIKPKLQKIDGQEVSPVNDFE